MRASTNRFAANLMCRGLKRLSSLSPASHGRNDCSALLQENACERREPSRLVWKMIPIVAVFRSINFWSMLRSNLLFWETPAEPFTFSCLSQLHRNRSLIKEGAADDEESDDYSIWNISTLKRRRKKMNKHKYRKRMKKLRFKTRKQ